jgi:iron complex outermembrane receptor protein
MGEYLPFWRVTGLEIFMAVGKKRVVANLRLAAFAGSAMISLMGASSVFAADVNFKISPQRLQSALFEYSEQAGVQLIIAADTKGLRLRRAVRGTMDIEAALAELIQGTDLEFHFTSSDTVTIRNRQLPPSVKAASGIVPEAQENGSAAPYQIEEIVSVGTRIYLR